MIRITKEKDSIAIFEDNNLIGTASCLMDFTGLLKQCTPDEIQFFGIDDNFVVSSLQYLATNCYAEEGFTNIHFSIQ